MTRTIAVLLALAMALASPAFAVETSVPSTFKSLQPFEHFAKGAGEGVAYEYRPRTKAQFVALLRDKKLAKKEMRVGCEVLVRQMVEAHLGLPFEGCEGAAATIEKDDAFAAVACRDEMFQRGSNWLTVTNETGSAFGIWNRTCLPNEQVLIYKNQPLISLTCLNVTIPVSPQPVAPPAPTPTPTPTPAAIGVCPNGWALVANAWSLKSLPDGLRRQAEELIAAADNRDSKNATNAEAYKPNAVSRTLGGQLRREIKIRAPVSADVLVQLRDPQIPQAVIQELGVLHLVDGIGSIPLSDDQHTKIVETIWPGRFLSPTMSGAARRLWLFPYEWKSLCEINVHGLIP